MNNTAKISCTIGTINPAAELGLEVWLDDQQLFDTDHVSDQQLEWQVTEDEADHELRFIMKNKTTDHTQVDENDKIIQDSRITIQNLCFNEMALGQLVIDHAEYIHDFNGTKDSVTDKFYGEMGCNGTVSLKFTTPIYIWLLENM
jgi:D-mannonate dehydratase